MLLIVMISESRAANFQCQDNPRKAKQFNNTTVLFKIIYIDFESIANHKNR